MGSSKVRVAIVGACVIVVGLVAIAIVSGKADTPGPGSEEVGVRTADVRSPEGQLQSASADISARTASQPGEEIPATHLLTNHERVLRHEALPCTPADEPTNFDVYSAGPSVAGVPLEGFTRRCGGTTPVDEPPANFTNYIYGDCDTGGGESGCEPPLEIQSWPACQRSLADYSFEGKPMPYRRLPDLGGAEVVEIDFEYGPRIEVYTGSSTIVIFAGNRALAMKALEQLRSQQGDAAPATIAGELKGGQTDQGLAPPIDGATEGEVAC